VEKRTLELVTVYDTETTIEVLVTDTSGVLSSDDWKIKGEEAADFFWRNIPMYWMEGFYRRLEVLEKEPFPRTLVSSKSYKEPLAVNRTSPKKVRSMMLD